LSTQAYYFSYWQKRRNEAEQTKERKLHHSHTQHTKQKEGAAGTPREKEERMEGNNTMMGTTTFVDNANKVMSVLKQYEELPIPIRRLPQFRTE